MEFTRLRGPLIIILAIWVFTTVPPVSADLDLGTDTLHVCREATTNFTWVRPGSDHKYNFIDLQYVRRPENGKVYKMVVAISWVPPGDEWTYATDPTRFRGRLNPHPANQITISFKLENTLRIDNGRYSLSASDKATSEHIYGTYHLIVYHERNYFPTLEKAGNDTDSSTYSYTWSKPMDSPAIGMQMTPEGEKDLLAPKQCFFSADEPCEVVFHRADLTTGRVNLHVDYLFPKNFTECTSLARPPSSLMIYIHPTDLAKGPVAGIVVALVVFAVVGGVLTYAIMRRRQTNKSSLTLKEWLEFVVACINGIQSYTDISELSGVYRRSTSITMEEASIESYKTECRRKKRKQSYDIDNSDDSVKFEDTDKKILASHIKRALRTFEVYWIAEDAQRKITENKNAFHKDDGSFDVEAVRELFVGTGKDEAIRRMILANIFRHFDRFLSSTAMVDRSEHKIVSRRGLADIIAPNFFQIIPKTLDEGCAYSAKWSSFIENVITHYDEVFPDEDDLDNREDKSGAMLMSRV